MSQATLDRLRAWSHRRLLLHRPASDPLEALRRLGAVYSSHPSGPLTLHARSAPFSPAEFGGLERDRTALRLPAMRTSVFLMPQELAGAAFAANRLPQDRLASRLRGLGLDVATYLALKPRILEAAREPLAPRELKTKLDAGQEAVWAMRTMAREGLVLRVGWGNRVRSDSLRWVATEAWLGRPLDVPSPEEGLRRLAERYYDAFGPARVADFAWWTGISESRAGEVVGGLPLEEVEEGLLLSPELASAYREESDGNRAPPDVVNLLPKWDAYTMAYAPDGRARLVDDAHLRLAYSTTRSKVGATAGDGHPLLLLHGRAVATWEHRLRGRRIQVTVRPFARDEMPPKRRIEEAFEPIGAFFEGAIELTVEL